MKVYRSLAEIPKIKNPVVTIGTFDGVHDGHRQIIERLKNPVQKLGERVLSSPFIRTRVLYCTRRKPILNC